MKLSHKIRYGILLLIPFIVVLLIAQFVYNNFIKIAPVEEGEYGLKYNDVIYKGCQYHDHYQLGYKAEARRPSKQRRMTGRANSVNIQ